MRSDSTNYVAADAASRAVIYSGDLKLLTSNLIKNAATDREKARAIFIWIADNIAYDHHFINKKKKVKPFKPNNKSDISSQFSEWEDDYLEKVLSRKRAICDGYAKLFNKMSNYAGLETDIVSGYTKDSPSHIGRMGEENHAWNAIVLDGKYYYLDVTWAAGGCGKDEDGKLIPFTKSFDNFYWLTPTDKFLRDHFPTDPKSPGVDNYQKRRYIDQAYINQEVISKIDFILPSSGIITARVGDTIRFHFNYDRIVSYLQCHTNIYHPKTPQEIVESGKIWTEAEVEKQRYIPFINNDGDYKFEFIVQDKRIRHIDIVADYRHLARFKIKIVENLSGI